MCVGGEVYATSGGAQALTSSVDAPRTYSQRTQLEAQACKRPRRFPRPRCFGSARATATSVSSTKWDEQGVGLFWGSRGRSRHGGDPRPRAQERSDRDPIVQIRVDTRIEPLARRSQHGVQPGSLQWWLWSEAGYARWQLSSRLRRAGEGNRGHLESRVDRADASGWRSKPAPSTDGFGCGSCLRSQNRVSTRFKKCVERMCGVRDPCLLYGPCPANAHTPPGSAPVVGARQLLGRTSGGPAADPPLLFGQ